MHTIVETPLDLSSYSSLSLNIHRELISGQEIIWFLVEGRHLTSLITVEL